MLEALHLHKQVEHGATHLIREGENEFVLEMLNLKNIEDRAMNRYFLELLEASVTLISHRETSLSAVNYTNVLVRCKQVPFMGNVKIYCYCRTNSSYCKC